MTSTLLAHQPPPADEEASARELLDCATQALRTRRLAEVAELRLAIQWAIIHGHPRDDRDPMVTPGGDGTPPLREHAVPELAMVRETHPATTRALIADGLDLVHRLPLTWAVVEAGDCEPWVARKVAVLTRSLLSEHVGRVDRAVAKAIRGHAPSTVLEIARAKVIEADPETHRAERERSRHERYVRLSRADEFGYRHLIARVTAGDAAWIDAMVERVAEILAETMGHDHNHDELRSLALGWLARPVDLLKLLLEHTRTGPDTETGVETGEPEQPAWAPDHMADTVDRLCSLPTRKLAQLRGRGRLFVHLTDDALRTGRGVARIEGVGPIDVRQLAEVLGNADTTLTPVLDLRCAAGSTPTSTPRPSRTTSGPRPAATASPTPPAPPPATASTTTTPSPTTTPDHPARPDPTTPDHSAAATTAPRPTAASPPESSAPADISGAHPTATPSSSTTPARRSSPTTRGHPWPKRSTTASSSTSPHQSPTEPPSRGGR